MAGPDDGFEELGCAVRVVATLEVEARDAEPFERGKLLAQLFVDAYSCRPDGTAADRAVEIAR